MLTEPIATKEENKKVVGGREIKKGPISHRYNLLPLLYSYPGGVHKELVVSDPRQRYIKKENSISGFELF